MRTWLPKDFEEATLVARVWDPRVDGPSPVLVSGSGLFDLSEVWPTVRDLCEEAPTVEQVEAAAGKCLFGLDDIVEPSTIQGDLHRHPHLLAPVDLQVIKAAGVTFADSLLERLVEEHVQGSAAEAEAVRRQLLETLGSSLHAVRPGSPEALELKRRLVNQGISSIYLEVALGDTAELFTKAPTLGSVGPGHEIGILSTSTWNNPEPEIAVAINSRGTAVGAMLGNDVNLRDVEGRSPLLLGRAKDNNASCSLGPFLRLFDPGFTMYDVENAVVELRVWGEDGFELAEVSDMKQISRAPAHLISQTIGEHHQYPDGVVLMLGTMFAPNRDRLSCGTGFTHMIGDTVAITSERLGSLTNRVNSSEACRPWTFGISALMTNLGQRSLLIRGEHA